MMKHKLYQYLLIFFVLLVALPAQAAEHVTYYVNDALGSPIMAMDEQGAVVWQESYEPYGRRQIKSTASQADEQFYTGKQEEPDIGLQYYGARWYDPEAGRFTSIDPVGVDEGNIHSFNRYAYANNNPYKYTDPDGKQGVSVNVPIASVNVDPGYQPYSGSSLGLGNAALDIRKFSNDMMIAAGSALAIEFSPLIISQMSIGGKAGNVAKSVTPNVQQAANINRFQKKIPSNSKDSVELEIYPVVV